MPLITVHKRDHTGIILAKYQGEVVGRGPMWLCLAAPFVRDDVDAGYVVFRRGDMMTEWFYGDRWYNVFRLEDVDDGRLKGWYCNITRPALLGEDVVAFDDLALDVFVQPDGQIIILDEDEFDALNLSPSEAAACWAAVDAIRSAVATREFPFLTVIEE